MGFNIAGVAEGAAGGILGAGMGLLLEGHNDRRQLEQEQKLQAQQMAGAKEMAIFNREQQMQMWRDTNYKAQVAELKKAGLNPGLIYGMSGGGGATANAAQAAGPTSGSAPRGGGEAMGLMSGAMEKGMQMALMQAQKENIEADTKNKLGDAANKPLLGKNIDADTVNKVLDSVIKDYTGRDVKDTYEQVKAPNRGIEADTYQKELEGRGGIAANIYELWRDGKLAERSNAEIEQILVGNAKSRTERQAIEKQMDLIEQHIRGARLENIMKDLEARLQTQTGIDRNSPAWMKVLGRLFIQLTGGQ